MTNQKLLVLAGLFAAPCALVIVACSSATTDSTTPAPAGTTPSTTTGADAGSTHDSAVAAQPDSATPTPTPDTDAGAACAHPPTLHPAKADAGVYCPFSRTAGGKDITCAVGEICCETPIDAGASTCNPGGPAAACPIPKSVVWECEGPAQCDSASAGVCCGTASALGADSTCSGFQKASGFTAAKCAASCAAGQYALCTGPSDCPSGKVCTPLKAVGNAIGFCL